MQRGKRIVGIFTSVTLILLIPVRSLTSGGVRCKGLGSGRKDASQKAETGGREGLAPCEQDVCRLRQPPNLAELCRAGSAPGDCVSLCPEGLLKEFLEAAGTGPSTAAGLHAVF